jgi:hypothetical protein
MTLRVPEPTRESVEAVRRHLSELGGRAQFRGRALGRANPLNLALAVPHDVYFLGLDDVAAGAGLDAARLVGRRFLVMDGDQAVASAEIAERDGAFQANEGPYVEATATAIVAAERNPRLADGEYEVRVLRIPALYFMALWLRDERGAGDVVIPLAPAPAPLEPGQPYPPEDVFSQLASGARRRLQVDDVGGQASPPS